MNFIAATVELRNLQPDPVNVYGIDYRVTDTVIPSSNSAGEVRLEHSAVTGNTSSLDRSSNGKQATER